MSEKQKIKYYKCYICDYEGGPQMRVCAGCGKTICPGHQEAVSMKWGGFFYSAPYTYTFCPNCWGNVKEGLIQIGFTIFGAEAPIKEKE